MIVLSVLCGLFSGLNLGIVGLDPSYLELLSLGPYESKEDERNAQYAKKILPLRKRGNLLICVILLGNVSVTSLLSILMADLTSGVVGVVVSTVIIMLFGEILPQALFSRHALKLGAHCIWILYLCAFVTFPISFPLSAILDKLLGEDVGNVYNKARMKKMFELYERENLLDPAERRILTAALDLQDKTAAHAMRKLEEVFMLDIDSVLDKQLLRDIYNQGYSRIPVYQNQRDSIVGLLFARDLILINPEVTPQITIRQLSSIIVKTVLQIDHATKLEPILSYFKKGHSHMGIVTQVETVDEDKDPQLKVLGVVTLDDIIEELVQREPEEDYQSGEKLRMKEKLVLLFNDNSLSSQGVLSEPERQAVCEFLQKQVKPFAQNRIRKWVLMKLIEEASRVMEVTSDFRPPTGLKYLTQDGRYRDQEAFLTMRASHKMVLNGPAEGNMMSHLQMNSPMDKFKPSKRDQIKLVRRANEEQKLKEKEEVQGIA